MGHIRRGATTTMSRVTALLIAITFCLLHTAEGRKGECSLDLFTDDIKPNSENENAGNDCGCPHPSFVWKHMIDEDRLPTVAEALTKSRFSQTDSNSVFGKISFSPKPINGGWCYGEFQQMRTCEHANPNWRIDKLWRHIWKCRVGNLPSHEKDHKNGKKVICKSRHNAATGHLDIHFTWCKVVTPGQLVVS